MVGHESVDPKPQEKSVLVYRCDLYLRETVLFIMFFFVRSNVKKKIVIIIPTFQYQQRHRWVKAKGNLVLIPEPGCGYVRSKRIQPSFYRSR